MNKNTILALAFVFVFGAFTTIQAAAPAGVGIGNALHGWATAGHGHARTYWVYY